MRRGQVWGWEDGPLHALCWGIRNYIKLRV